MIEKIDERRAAADAGRLLYGTPDEPELERMAKAGAESREYGLYLQEFLDISDALEGLAEDEQLLSEVDHIDVGGKTAGEVSATGGKWWRYCAAAAMVLALSVLIVQIPSQMEPEIEASRYVTRIGEQRDIELADGTRVKLNTGTELIAMFEEQQRKIVMRRGEAFFEVAQDPTQPFTILVGEQAVTVLGTSFNLRKGIEGFTLAVREGHVAVHLEHEAVSAGSEEINLSVDDRIEVVGFQQRRFKAGMVANFDVSRRVLTAYRPASLKSFLGWRSGVLRFEGIPLSEVVMELNRYSAKKILIRDSELLDVSIFASVRVDDISGALNVLDMAFPVDVVHQFDQIVLVAPKEK